MSKQVHLVLNGKGGVGKSFFATNFVQYLKDRQVPHTVIDTDNENSTLKRFHPEAQFIRIENAREIDQLFSALDQASLVVADCRAASTDIFLRYFQAVELFEALEDWNASLTIISPVNHEPDSVEQVRLVSDRLRDQCRYLVVQNQAHSERFDIYQDSRTRARVLGELGGQEMIMPRLADWLVTALNRHNLTITPALTSPAIAVLDRQRLKVWQREFYRELDRVLHLPEEPPQERPTRTGKQKQ